MSKGLLVTDGICTGCGETTATTVDPHFIGRNEAIELDVDEGDFHPDCCPHPDCAELHVDQREPTEVVAR